MPELEIHYADDWGPDPVDVCRWTGCSFLVIPIGVDSFAVPAGKPVLT